jgi:putative RNA 2'-phosphotransferase
VEKTPPDILYHGTSFQHANLIISSGIKKMKRQYVHLSDDVETAITVGSRHGDPFVFTVAALAMYTDGCKFYRSDNGVWLTDYIDSKYLDF